MNKIAERIVPAMNDEEPAAVISDHYADPRRLLASAQEGANGRAVDDRGAPGRHAKITNTPH